MSFPRFLFVSNDRIGTLSLRFGRSCSKITVAAVLNFDAAFSATASPEPNWQDSISPSART
jgi:hypothetical protein